MGTVSACLENASSPAAWRLAGAEPSATPTRASRSAFLTRWDRLSAAHLMACSSAVASVAFPSAPAIWTAMIVSACTGSAEKYPAHAMNLPIVSKALSANMAAVFRSTRSAPGTVTAICTMMPCVILVSASPKFTRPVPMGWPNRRHICAKACPAVLIKIAPTRWAVSEKMASRAFAWIRTLCRLSIRPAARASIW